MHSYNYTYLELRASVGADLADQLRLDDVDDEAEEDEDGDGGLYGGAVVEPAEAVAQPAEAAGAGLLEHDGAVALRSC